MLGTSGSSPTLQWDGGMLHPMFVMPADSSGAAAVTLRFTITDSDYVPGDGHAPVDATVTFIAIPEPSMPVLALSGVGAVLIRRKRFIG